MAPSKGNNLPIQNPGLASGLEPFPLLSVSRTWEKEMNMASWVGRCLIVGACTTGRDAKWSQVPF